MCCNNTNITAALQALKGSLPEWYNKILTHYTIPQKSLFILCIHDGVQIFNRSEVWWEFSGTTGRFICESEAQLSFYWREFLHFWKEKKEKTSPSTVLCWLINVVFLFSPFLFVCVGHHKKDMYIKKHNGNEHNGWPKVKIRIPWCLWQTNFHIYSHTHC